MRERLDQLNVRLASYVDLKMTEAVLSWDQETYMPPRGIEARAAQLATVGQIAHELFTSEEIGELLDSLAEHLDDLDYDSDEASLIRVTKRDYDRATKIPSELVAEIARATSLGQQAWQQARSESDFGRFAPHLEHILELVLQKAEAVGYEDRVYDALLDEFEPQVKTAGVEAIFSTLKSELVPMVQAIAGREPEDFPFLARHYDESKQWDFGIDVMRDFGFEFDRGRQDRSAHPFTTNFSVNDVRTTTRIYQKLLPSGLFSTLHECGHALYEQGIADRFERTILAGGASLGVHESQSRLWEMLVGRSREFWTHYYPRLSEYFPDQLRDVDAEQFYRAINQVRPSLIRVEADEITYNLHVMLRFELENDLLEGRLTAADLPDAWNAAMHDYLGVTPSNDAEGVLQDIHWSMGAIGYFPTYTLGNLMSAQLFERVVDELPNVREQIARGRFAALLEWLRDNVYRHGRKFTAEELLLKVTGQRIAADSWLRYVKAKY